ncbi:MAG TPA: hypothetical protein VFG71_01965 [Nitrospiraceae bacterium]|nr:hypothetical protein [Nitrospiraceae bacterium]
MRSFSHNGCHVVAAYVLGALLIGCGRMVSFEYEPTNPWKGQGTVAVLPFRYEAAENDRVKPREVETNRAARTELFLSQEISSFFTEALQEELVHSGYAIDKSSPVTIRGAVTRFYVDWRNGVERFFELHATYTVQSQGHAPFTWECSSLQYGPNTLAQDSILIRKGTANCMQRFIQAALEATAL